MGVRKAIMISINSITINTVINDEIKLVKLKNTKSDFENGLFRVYSSRL